MCFRCGIMLRWVWSSTYASVTISPAHDCSGAGVYSSRWCAALVGLIWVRTWRCGSLARSCVPTGCTPRRNQSGACAWTSCGSLTADRSQLARPRLSGVLGCMASDTDGQDLLTRSQSEHTHRTPAHSATEMHQNDQSTEIPAQIAGKHARCPRIHTGPF